MLASALHAIPSGYPNRAIYLSNLCGALQTRFEQTGTIDDLDQAITAGRDAVAATPTDHPERAGSLSNLGLWLWVRFERTGAIDDLDQAITGWTQATQTPTATVTFRLISAARWAYAAAR